MHNYLCPQKDFRPSIGDAVEFRTYPGHLLYVHQVYRKSVEASRNLPVNRCGLTSAAGHYFEFFPYYPRLIEESDA